MSWFRNRRTFTKLMIANGLAATLTVALGIVTLVLMGGIQENLELTTGHDVLLLEKLATIQEDTHLARALEVEHVLAADPQIKRECETEIARLDVSIEGAMTAIEGASLSPEERRLLESFDRSWERYKQARDSQALSPSSKGQEELAWAASLGTVKSAFEETSGPPDQLLAMQIQSADERAEHGRSEYGYARRLALALMVLTVAVAVAFGLGIARSISGPLSRASRVLESVGAGDLTSRLDYASSDEIGEMAGSLDRSLNAMRTTLGDVRAAAGHGAAAAQQLTASAQQLSSGAQEQSASLEETAAALQQITSAVKQSAENAREANRLAMDSRTVAEKGGGVVAAAVGSMSEINEASKKIAEIITTIDEIAFQTNLLALNAAVEAARAGEQGRGFAVVATEVRNLAQRSATAAKEIKGLIRDSVAKVDAGSDLVNESGRTLAEIITSVKQVTEIMSGIATAAQQQSAGIEQLNITVAQMDQVLQSNAAQSEELSSTSEALSSQAEELLTLVRRFKLDDGDAARVSTTAPPSRGFERPRRLQAAVFPISPPSAARPRTGLRRSATGGTMPQSDEADGFVEF
jgi:methyl-accepting chemotaxis protein